MANIAKINVSGYDYNIKDSLAWEHFEDFNNPHLVSKTQIGLGNVADLKPEEILEMLSYYQIVKSLGYTPANAAALDNKLDKNMSNQQVTSIVDFVNGIKLNGALIQYNPTTNTITFS